MALTEIYIDPTLGSDHEGASFTDGSFANATLTLSRTGAFVGAASLDKFFLTDNGSGEVTPGMYTIDAVTDAHNVVLVEDIRSGANDPTDVVLTQGTGLSDAAAYATLQHAFNDTVQGAGGDRFNLKVGSEVNVLGGPLDLSTYTVPTVTQPLVIQGYASAAGDGDWDAQTGIGQIDGANSQLFDLTTLDFITLRHLEIYNRAGAGYGALLRIDQDCHIIECEIHTHSGTGGMVVVGVRSVVRRCHLHDVDSAILCLTPSSGGVVIEGCYFDLGNNCTYAIISNQNNTTISRNVFRLAGDVNGILLAIGSGSRVVENDVFSNGSGTRVGIDVEQNDSSILNNVVEGFTSGIVLDTDIIAEFGGNHCYNNTTNYTVTVPVLVDYGDNEDRSSGDSPFTNAAAQNFTPLDKGNMKEQAWPPSIVAADGNLTAVNKRWKGAIEPAEPAGGGGLLIHPGMGGGFRG